MASILKFMLIASALCSYASGVTDFIDASSNELFSSILDICESPALNKPCPHNTKDCMHCNMMQGCSKIQCISLRLLTKGATNKWFCCRDGGGHKCKKNTGDVDLNQLCGVPPTPTNVQEVLAQERAIVKWVMPDTRVPVLDYTLEYRCDGGTPGQLSGLTTTNVTLPNTMSGDCEARVRSRGFVNYSEYSFAIKIDNGKDNDQLSLLRTCKQVIERMDNTLGVLLGLSTANMGIVIVALILLVSTGCYLWRNRSNTQSSSARFDLEYEMDGMKTERPSDETSHRIDRPASPTPSEHLEDINLIPKRRHGPQVENMVEDTAL